MSNNAMWVTLAIFGGLYAYNTLKKDGGKVIEATADALNITKDTNLAYKGTSAVFGEDFVIDKIGGSIAKLLGTDPKKQIDQPKPANNQVQYINLPAREQNGKWYKLINNTWQPLMATDRVVNVSGKYVVKTIKAAAANYSNTVGVLKPSVIKQQQQADKDLLKPFGISL